LIPNYSDPFYKTVIAHAAMSNNYKHLSKNISFIFLISLIHLYSTCKTQEYKVATNYGGNRMYKEFIKKEMVYPENALKNNIQGTVILSFNVDPEGNIINLMIKQSVSKEIDLEAMRIFNKLLWEPAIYRGAYITDKKSISIKFSIKKYKRWCKERGYNQLQYSSNETDSSNKIYNYNDLDLMPEPLLNGEKVKINKFISNNIDYPEDAFKNNVSGTVTVQFIIETNGQISNVRALNVIGAGCSEEAIRLIKMLTWTQGFCKGYAVRTRMRLDITFGLKSYSGYIYSPNFQNNSMM